MSEFNRQKTLKILDTLTDSLGQIDDSDSIKSNLESVEVSSIIQRLKQFRLNLSSSLSSNRTIPSSLLPDQTPPLSQTLPKQVMIIITVVDRNTIRVGLQEFETGNIIDYEIYHAENSNYKTLRNLISKYKSVLISHGVV